MNRITIYLFVLLACLSCRGKNGKETGEGKAEPCDVKYAEGFRVDRYDGYTSVTVYNPWDTARILQRYLLVPKDREVPPSLPRGTLVRTPLGRVAVYSSVHCSMLGELGLLSVIAGVCEVKYIHIPYIREKVQAGEMADLGESFSPDTEKIIELNPEAILTSPFQNTGYGKVEKLGIPIIECADYMETSPLGRAEWIRLLGLFFGKEAESDSLFAQTESSYLSLKEKAASVKKHPTVLSEMKTGMVWYVPGGNSYMARLFDDAGADYFWKDVPQPGSLSLSFETVFDKAHEADFWLVKYNREKDMTLGDLRRDYAPNANFRAFKEGNVWGSNSAKVPFYEEMPLHPDYLLRDFIMIFHPGLLPGDTLRYFKHLGN